MDEHQTTLQSNSSDAASDDLSNSILGKMKCSVSKMLPNSISKWLSPKVDAQNSRRRRHDELDSEEEETEPNRSLAFGNITPSLTSRNNNYAQRTATTLSAVPPTKRQRVFEPSTQPFSPSSTYSMSQTLLPRRESIISSTLIEDTTPALYRPHENGTESARRSLDRIAALDNNNQFRRSPLAATASSAETRSSNNDLNFPPSRSQPTVMPTYRAERDLDETSSNRSSNLFALNNDSMAVNFSAHLQKSKSLFSNKSYVSQSSRSLSNYRMRRQPNSSLYRSTSSLCDNNSNASSNTSSVLSSPFYTGQTTFGGASAQSKRFASAFHSQQHRAKIPSRLVPSNLSKSTSSLNVNEESTMSRLSSTAQRILEVMNQSSTPLGDVRRVSNALPTAATATSSTASNRRLPSVLEMSTESRESEVDGMKRRLFKPNTPYNRPVGRLVTEPSFTQGLNVPSMPQLLQLKKKLTDNTHKIREIAAKPNSILDYKSSERSVASTDLDATNNNHKSSSTVPPITTNNKHVTKIRNNNISKQRKAGKANEHEMPPEPVDIPNVQLKLNSTDIKMPAMSFPAPKAPVFESKKINEPIAKSKPVDAPAPIFKITQVPAAVSKASEGLFSSPFSSSTSTSTTALTSTTKSNNIFGSVTFNAVTPSSSSSAPSSSSVEIISATPAVSSEREVSYKFSAPIYVKRAAESVETDSYKIQEKHYKFSEPIVIKQMKSSSISKSSPAPPEPKKSEAVPTKASTTTAAPAADDIFKKIVSQQSAKWSCSSCFASNEKTATKCVCCGASHESPATASSASTDKPKATISSSSGATATVDDVFKSIVAKQKQSKWVCDSCMADNDVAQAKCLCCGDSKPGSAPAPAPAISSSNAKVDDLFKSIVAKQKSSTWECSACATKNDMSKSKCVCCQQAKESDTTAATSSSGAPTSTPKFAFGSGGIDLGVPSGKFSFGSKPAAEPIAAVASTPTAVFGAAKEDDTAKSTASTVTFVGFSTVTTTPKFSFGSPATGTKPAVPLGTFAFGGSAPKVDSTSSSSTLSVPTFAAPVAVTSTTTFGTPSTATPTATQSTTTGLTSSSTSTMSSAPFSFGTPSTVTTTAPAADDMFKKIVSQQTAKWSCPSCMAQNNQTDTVCACCSTPKSGSSAGEKKTDSTVKSGFSFGTPPTSTFSFGSKPTATPTASFQFGAPAQPAVTSSNAVTSTSSTFSLSSSQPSFGSPFGIQKTIAESSTVTSSATTTASKPFQFGFGSSAPTFGAPKFGSPITASSDVTDAATPSMPPPKAIEEKKDNLLVQPPVSVEPPKAMFSFGAPNTNDDKTKSISLKRTNTDVSTEPNLFKTPNLAGTSALSTASFVFGQPSSTTNSMGASAATSAPVSAPAFSFGVSNNNQSLQFGAPEPALNAPATAPVFGSSSFPSPTPATTTANAPQNAFPSNAFSFGANNATPSFGASNTTPSFGASNATPSFGASNAAPSFGNPIQSPAPTEQAQSQSGLFQFGGSANQSVAPAADAFHFNANAAPSFNFSATQPQPQADASPFQFSQAAPTGNLFAPQSSMKDRRKLRPVRRVNRP